ncbi:MAG: hypothetical protein J1G30_02015 [Spirochaetales bacterium]|nr:hypothetical protein [Spirochaetales bacterium]
MEENFRTNIIVKDKIRSGQGVDFFGMPANPGTCYGVTKSAGYKGEWADIETFGTIKNVIPGEVIKKGDKINFKNGFVCKCADNEPIAGYALQDADEKAEYISIFKTGV